MGPHNSRDRIPSMATVEEAITALGRLIEEADQLLPYYRAPDFEEKLTFWTKRGRAQLRDWGLHEESERFNVARGSRQTYDRASDNYSTLKARIVILEVLREDVTKHPDFYTERAKPTPSAASQVAPKVGVKHDKIFLGHGRSLLWNKVERWLERDKGLRVEAWEAESHAGEHVIQVLQGFLDSSTFTVLVVTGEDATATGTVRARQNVIHEIGLFQGKLGFKRVALLEQDAIEGFSNIDGLQTIPFPNEKIEAAFPELERMLKREGVLK